MPSPVRRLTGSCLKRKSGLLSTNPPPRVKVRIVSADIISFNVMRRVNSFAQTAAYFVAHTPSTTTPLAQMPILAQACMYFW
jgi:hypothetical protein